MNQKMEIDKWRLAAAHYSGGSSGEPIYALFERTVTQAGITGHVLDFGAGKGAFARRLSQLPLNLSLTCVDLLPRPENLPEEIEWREGDLNYPLDMEDQSFDAILSPEVIEHLENPRAVVREWARLVKPGGWILFSTPNNESFRSLLALAFRGHYAAFGDASYPAHITALVRKDIERIVIEAGLEPCSFSYTDVGMLPKARRLRWQDLSGRMFRGLRYSDNLLAMCRRKPQ